MSEAFDSEVIIIGSGPVGMSTAIMLNRYGIKTTIIERRAFDEPANVKSNHVSSRTMERFRALGIVEQIRSAGLPKEYPNDISFRLGLTGEEIGRIPIPSRADRYISHNGPDTKWATPEPAHRINQTFLEPVLRDIVAKLSHVTLVNESEYLHYEQDATGVTVHIKSSVGEGNEVRTLTGRYLIGADGGSSTVRKQIGAKLIGDPSLQDVMSTCIRAPKLYEKMPGEPAWAYYSMSIGGDGHVYAIDGQEVFLVHRYLTKEEVQTGSVDRDESIRSILGVDDTFEYEILSHEDWTARRLVAERFRDQHVFLVGDAAHLWVPYAGYGMNAGIADGLNIAWLIAARLEGWAEEAFLDAYEAERLPITTQVSKFAMGHAEKVRAARRNVQTLVGEGAEEKVRAGQEAVVLNTQQFAAEGLNFGYVYDQSPIIAYDGHPAPAYTMGSYQPSTVPGCRLPHFWLRPGESIYDALGPFYTLLRMDSRLRVDGLMASASKVNIPLQLVDVPIGTSAPGIDHGLIIVRADQHIAWRGYSEPTDSEGLAAVLRGAALVPDHVGSIREMATQSA